MEKKIEKEEILADRTKKTNKMKGDKLAEWEEANPFDEDDYKYPTADMLK